MARQWETIDTPELWSNNWELVMVPNLAFKQTAFVRRAGYGYRKQKQRLIIPNTPGIYEWQVRDQNGNSVVIYLGKCEGDLCTRIAQYCSNGSHGKMKTLA